MSQRLGCDFWMGMPRAIFDIALLWQPVAKVTRREGFPSWSWAGWLGEVQWLGDSVMGLYGGPNGGIIGVNKSLRQHSWVVWWKVADDGKLEPVWDADQSKNIGEMFWPVEGVEARPSIGYASSVSDSDTTRSDPYGRSTNLERFPLNLLPKDTSTPSTSLIELAKNLSTIKDITPLFFTTLSVQLAIKASPQSYIRYGAVDPVWINRGRLVFLLYLNASDHNPNSYSDDHPVGYVLLDETFGDTKFDLSKQEFLLLSEADYNCEYGRPHERHGYKKYWGEDNFEEVHIMMVVWRIIGDGVKVAERAGIGRVLGEALQDVEHGIKTIDVALT